MTVPTDEEMVGAVPAHQVARTIERLRREMRDAAKQTAGNAAVAPL